MTGPVGPQGPAGADGAPGAQGPVGPPGPGVSQHSFRWTVFSTYIESGGWILQNDPAYFGGVAPSNWTDGNAIASQMSPDKDVLRTLFVNKMSPGKGALVWAETWGSFSSTNGHVVTALMRIRNTTASPIQWPVTFTHSCYGPWSEWASAALNGVSVFTTSNCNPVGTTVVLDLTIPAGRTSTAIFVSTSGMPFFYVSSAGVRTVVMAFKAPTFDLPAGLELVDDLDTATGGWEN